LNSKVSNGEVLGSRSSEKGKGTESSSGGGEKAAAQGNEGTRYTGAYLTGEKGKRKRGQVKHQEVKKNIK